MRQTNLPTTNPARQVANPARPTTMTEPPTDGSSWCGTAGHDQQPSHRLRRFGSVGTAYRGDVADSVMDAAHVAEDALIAVSERSAARLARVTMRQLRYWAATGVVV